MSFSRFGKNISILSGLLMQIELGMVRKGLIV